MQSSLLRSLCSVLAPMALSAAALAGEVVVLRSGQFQGAPGTVPTNPPASLPDDGLRCLPGAGPGALSPAPFASADFFAARSGPPAILVATPGVYLQELECDSRARWVHSDHSAIVNGLSNYPARSVLYAIDFQIQTGGNPNGTIQFCWSVDNQLGDNGPNPDGVYLNGVPLSSDFRGGDNWFQSAATQTNVPLLTGLNTLYIYQVDNGTGCCAGLNFSCRISVDAPEVIRLRTGQVGGVPGTATASLPANADDSWRFNPIMAATGVSGAPFTAGDFVGAALGPFAEVIQHGGPYINGLACDSDARWINVMHDPSFLGSPFNMFTSTGIPPRSTLYACPFEVTTEGNPYGTIWACWAADDRLGDPPGGPNPIGVYLNGQPLSSDFAGGSLNAQTAAFQSDVPLLTGTNYLYVYLRDTAGLATGLNFYAAITPQCEGGRYESFCFGDGGNGAGCTDCPCNNNAPSGTGGGCLNVANRSARLHASGIARVAADTLRFEIRDATSFTFAALLSAPNRLPNNPSNPCFGFDSGIQSIAFDGLRCIGGGTTRHGTRATNGMGHVGTNLPGWGPPDGPTGGLIAFNGFVAGETRHFQAVYRESPNVVCGTGQNTTQGVTVTLAP